jgi:hypothetical protein
MLEQWSTDVPRVLATIVAVRATINGPFGFYMLLQLLSKLSVKKMPALDKRKWLNSLGYLESTGIPEGDIIGRWDVTPFGVETAGRLRVRSFLSPEEIALVAAKNDGIPVQHTSTARKHR